MKRINLILVLFSFSICTFAQKNEYAVFTDSVVRFIQVKDFTNAYDYSIKALAVHDENKVDAQFLYNCAVLAARNNETDLGIYLMRQAIKAGFCEYAHAALNKDFSPNDIRWQQCLEKIKHNSLVISHLSLVLDSIYREDQNIRELYISVRGKNDIDSLELVTEKMRTIDSLNLKKVEEIMSEYGYYGRSLKGIGAQVAIFLVIQHSDNYAIMDKYFPVFKEALKRGEFIPSNLAYLEDRLLLKKCGKQKYGTQYTFMEDGSIVFYPLLDETKVDQYRSELGLKPLAEYKKEVGGV